jgi:UrcA family protein
MKTLIAISAFALLPVAAVAAQPPAFSVDYSDLNLANHADVETLFERIEKAARGYCAAPGYSMRMSVGRCTRKLTAETIASIDVPEVRIAYASR